MKRRDGQLLCMAGLWNKPKRGDASWYTFTVVTAEASTDLQWLHNRMPIMLHDVESIKQWIDPEIKWSPKLLDGLKMVQSEDELMWYKVSPEVGKVKNNYASLNQKDEKKSINEFFKGGAVKVKKQNETENKSKVFKVEPVKVTQDNCELDARDELEKPESNKRHVPSPKASESPKRPRVITTGNSKITSFFRPK